MTTIDYNVSGYYEAMLKPQPKTAGALSLLAILS
jgi:hypothetical protein